MTGKIVNSTFISLDGVVNHMEHWHFDLIDEDTNRLTLEQLTAADALLMGRKTYEAYAGVWPGRDGAYADRINSMPKYVASRTLERADWEHSTVLKGDLIEEVETIKGESDERLLMHGFGPVARALLRHGLLDELHLWLHPVLAGVGTVEDTILTEGLNARLELVGTETFGSGVVVLSYRV
ncbi:dihydrofolate reductase family protein [Glycomyces sp. TRM65418]|uniref:dihydrofolate reductase family protein n=1 Tax=Glycomyces sp. TRM65418 TaxID=2867006 RepID=UPI001CE58B92|nr:dihydrofolate reductase family protein [Glycomyces sp. TRM65418]MCC3765610.1 dihydrofolate reductase family protein [Glycomyces sp. TRM65418]QZD55211.1 dihydrofolate reductase family protein [Glycomyces sp. TRM65418]